MKKMTMKTIMRTAILLGVLLAGCAQKIPVNTGGNVGLIAIPMNSIISTTHPFVYSYELSSSTNNDIKITLKPTAGRHFAFSAVIPAGDYAFDTFTMHSTQYDRISTPFNKRSTPLSSPITFTIQPGKILLADTVLEVKNVTESNEQFYQTAQWKKLEREKKEIYMEQLRKMENIMSWQKTAAGGI